jgi:hypothetical protein
MKRQGNDCWENETFKIREWVPTFDEIDGQIPEMRPILRRHKPADTEPHSPQCSTHATDNEQQTHNDKHSKDRLHIVKERVRTVAGAHVHFVKRKAVVEDQQSGENKDDQAPE